MNEILGSASFAIFVHSWAYALLDADTVAVVSEVYTALNFKA
jgi:hypothetical protein